MPGRRTSGNVGRLARNPKGKSHATTPIPPGRHRLAVLARSGRIRAGADDRPAPVIDTHLHCFAGKDDPRFPYHPEGPYQPAEPATPEHLLRCMAEAGVDHAVVVHPEPYQDDHRYLEHCLEVGQGKLKGTCLFFADRPGSLDRMTALVKKHEGRIVAARIHAYAPDRLPPFGKPELRAFWKHVGDLGLAVQLHFEPRYAPGFEPLDPGVPADHGRSSTTSAGPFQGTPGGVRRRARLGRGCPTRS